MPHGTRPIEIEQVQYQPSGESALDLEVFSMSDLRRRVPRAHLQRHHRYDFHMFVLVRRGICRAAVDFSHIECGAGSLLTIRTTTATSKPATGTASRPRVDGAPRQHDVRRVFNLEHLDVTKSPEGKRSFPAGAGSGPPCGRQTARSSEWRCPRAVEQRLFDQGQVAAIGSSSFEHEGEQPIRLGVPRETGTPASWQCGSEVMKRTGFSCCTACPGRCR